MGYKKKKSTKNVKKAPSKDVEGERQLVKQPVPIVTRNVVVSLIRCDIPVPVVKFDYEDFKHLRLNSTKRTATAEPMNICETPEETRAVGTSNDALNTTGETVQLVDTPQTSGRSISSDASMPGEIVSGSTKSSHAPKSKLNESQPSSTPKSSRTSKPRETQKAKQTPEPAHVPFYACVLWSPKIKEDMDEHKKVGNKLFSILGIGKMISEKVLKENPNMTWRNKFLLLDVDYREGMTALKDTDDSYIIPVVEKDAVDNINKPAAQWMLHISGHFSQLAQEILRCPPTTVMIWGARHCLAEGFNSPADQPQQTKSQGNIYIESGCAVNIIIFHAEVISNERIRDMKGDFGKAELGAFKEAYRRRICHSFIDGGTVAVHFSKYHDAKYNTVSGKKEVIPIPRPAIQ
ncbi:hypothetical protein Ocin01_15465 [Orchesella cincta]|uniref:Uncharacterized protein n=1 Tax=Orchesella cincta TaxID=48709 RepID=A0A1D2ME40_ORCCI|nr:hypothetical protein Ocin01_15465 [Orchesella cincta]